MGSSFNSRHRRLSQAERRQLNGYATKQERRKLSQRVRRMFDHCPVCHGHYTRLLVTRMRRRDEKPKDERYHITFKCHRCGNYADVYINHPTSEHLKKHILTACEIIRRRYIALTLADKV